MNSVLYISVSRNGDQFQQDYIRGIAQHDLYMSDSADTLGTEIILKPDTVIFGDMAFSQEILCDWIKEKSADIGNLIIKVHCVE